jgi:arsenate reductase-like glutaredoxin family protein
MTDALDVLVRGSHKNTRQGWQFFDRLSERVGWILVMIQAGWSDGSLSANTHGLAMCNDYRVWNLTFDQRKDLTIYGRDLMGTMWERLEADGFDPHFHNNLIGDMPATSSALNQVYAYKQGRNGLANNHFDRNPYRPDPITFYQFQEDDMTPEEHKMLEELHRGFKNFRENELSRDEAERIRDKERFRKLITEKGEFVDQLTVIANKTTDAATKKQVKRLQEKVLLELKEDPDVKEEDNPSEDGLAERNMG